MSTMMSEGGTSSGFSRISAPDHVAPSVLTVAKAIVARGWLQHGWCEGGPTGFIAQLLQGPPTPEQVEQACLVAAITVAAHSGGPFVNVRRDAMPWTDAVWRALYEPAGTPRRALPPAEHVRRIRDLTVWNDAPGRTRDDVIALLDRADRLARKELSHG